MVCPFDHAGENSVTLLLRNKNPNFMAISNQPKIESAEVASVADSQEAHQIRLGRKSDIC
jgi:hypothetical protein